MLLSTKRLNNKLSLLVGCFPLISQQQTVTSSMLTQLLIYSRRAAVEKSWKSRLFDEPSTSQLVDFYPPPTVFDVATPALITFLNASQLTLLTCSTDKDLDFYSIKNKVFSFLFNLFFKVQPLTERIGYDQNRFYPQAIDVPAVTHEQKLRALGYQTDLFYPVFIIPKKVKDVLAELSNRFPGTDHEILAIELACFMDIFGKLSPSKDVKAEVKKVIPILELPEDLSGQVSELSPEEILNAFPAAQKLFRTTQGNRVLKEFVGKLLNVKPGNYVD
ncbi:unnamed protein product [Bursaphelenchus xylophilus]|uniref:(pine wood nematode) hypothetical protein n=1 Tax=Bursaphelenchus xylophilus TaxID=6326 RepID=A0A7I8XMU2_BURXY|nr:unnamed protein product [Bursaphelenchus xylophilus]CAG9125051.1 unnamed protein product [Bursaphelenchus xylophilus]